MSKQGKAALAALQQTLRKRADTETAESGDPPTASKRVGRPPGGKRANKAIYRQVSAWVRRDTYNEVSIGLITESEGQPRKKEFSELVQELLEQWLAARASRKKRLA